MFLFSFFPVTMHKNKTGLYPTYYRVACLQAWTCLHACQFLDLGVFYTRLLPGHSRRHDERNRKFALSSEKLVVWVRDHLPGILLGSMVHRVLAIGPRPAADTAAAREFFYQEKKKKTSQLLPSISNGSQAQLKYSFMSLRSAGLLLMDMCSRKPERPKPAALNWSWFPCSPVSIQCWMISISYTTWPLK